MTISGIRRTCAVSAGVLMIGPSVAVGQLEMKLPRMIGSPGIGLPVRQMQVQQMPVGPIGQAPRVSNRNTRWDSAGARVPTSSRSLSRPSSHSSSSSSVHASVSGDKFSGRLHVGSDMGLIGSSRAPVLDHRIHEVHERILHNGDEYPVHLPGYGWRYPYSYWYANGLGWPYTNSYYGSIDGSYYQRSSPQPQQPAAAPEPVEPPTDEELAEYELRFGEPDDAVDLYRKILRDEPQDAASMRGLAVALLKDIRFEEGVAMMAMAYRTDALLADETLGDWLFEDEKELHRLLEKCVRHAHRTKLASAWLTVAVLMQAEDRDETALKMMTKASGFGLDVEIVDSMTRALGG